MQYLILDINMKFSVSSHDVATGNITSVVMSGD